MSEKKQANTAAEDNQALYADIAVALPVRQAYTYRVPDALRPQADAASLGLRVGSIVRVPVRGKSTEGVVTALSAETTAPKNRLKDITRILTPEYAISADLMALGAWMTQYYLAGPGETLSTISFFGLTDQKPRTERRLALSDPSACRDALDDNEASTTETSAKALKLTAAQGRVARFFLEELNEPRIRAEICRRVPCSRDVLERLVKKDILSEQIHSLDRPDDYVQDPAASHAASAGTAPHALSPEQRVALPPILKALDPPRFESFLLYGVTGSGKTEVYLQAIARALELDRQAIVLVPEISLTPQAVERFRSRFGPRVGVYHSHLTLGQKYDLWRRIESTEVQVLIGARSAIFAPFPNLGLIIVDEEHEHSYKQSSPAPRYHARDVAVWRSQRAGIPVVLGSATPSLESVLNSRPTPPKATKGKKQSSSNTEQKEAEYGKGKYTLLELSERVGESVLPEIRLVDMGSAVRDERRTSLLSAPLEKAIGERLKRGEQTILFLNRRGFSNFLLCMSCKTPVRCTRCDVVLTWHKSIGRLMCHFCGLTRPRVDKCPECDAPDPAPMGAGTQRIEEEVQALFPDASLLRIDADTTRGKLGFLQLWDKIEKGESDILLGTQMIAKGLHLERVTLVGVISADHALFLPDFRAAERAFALLTQVAGRAGRLQTKGEVLIQTFVPNHYGIVRAVAHDPQGFWRQELHMREMLRFPPYFRLLLMRLSGLKPERVSSRANRLARLLRDRLARSNQYRSISLLGPVPCPITRIKDKTRWQIVLRGQNPALMRSLLFEALGEFEKDKGRAGVNLTLDMDPMDLL